MVHTTILTEDFAGMKSQAFGLAERAGFETTLCNLTPKLPWSLISAPYWPFPKRSVHPFSFPDSQVIISVGSVGGAVNAALRQKNRAAIHIQNPRISIDKFDLVIVNPHDQISGKNILISRTALHHFSPELLQQSHEKWSPFFMNYKKPLISVLIGGNNGRFTLGKKEALHIATQLASVIKQENVGLALTPSRRTDPEAIKIFQDILNPLGAFIWDGSGENPYLGLLACADIILVTTDSVSMISEAAATNAPIMIIPLPGQSKRISFFLQTMQQAKRVKSFQGQLKSWSVTPMDDTQEIVFEVKKRLSL